MADNYTMRVRSGDVYNLSLTYRGPDPDNDPINLTGYTFSWYVKVGAVENTYTASPEIVVTTPATGVISLKLSSTQTAAFLTGRGRFHFKAINASGEPSTLLEGDVDVEFNE